MNRVMQGAMVAMMFGMLAACQSPAEEVAYTSPSQPDDVALSGKADELDRSIRKEDTSESLRSSALRNLVCNAVIDGADTTTRALESDCTGQDFEVTAFYTNTDLIYRDKMMLVAMDVSVKTSDGAAFRTKLVRDIASPSLELSWRGEFLEVASAPNTAALDAIIDEGDAWPDYGNDDHFTEVDFGELPNAAQIGAEEQASYIEDELAEEYPDEYWVERAHAYKLVGDDGNVVGYAVSYSLSYGNGDGGVTFYFDAEGNFIEERRYYA